jgi:hypothetical protein
MQLFLFRPAVLIIVDRPFFLWEDTFLTKAVEKHTKSNNLGS